MIQKVKSRVYCYEIVNDHLERLDTMSPSEKSAYFQHKKLGGTLLNNYILIRSYDEKNAWRKVDRLYELNPTLEKPDRLKKV